MAANNNNNSKKIPGAAVALALVIVAVAVFITTVYSPYKRKKPEMDEKHQEVLAEIQMYEDAIADQKNIQSDIDTLEGQWADFQKEMFVDADASLKDINDKVKELKFGLSNFQRGTPTPDEDGAVSFTGSPLYYVQLSISGYTDRDTLLDLLKFIEEESLGHYYVKSFAASTMQEDQKVSDEIQVKEGDLQVYMNVYLYYYDQTQVVEAPAEESAE